MSSSNPETTLGLAPASAVIVDFLAARQAFAPEPIGWEDLRRGLTATARATLTDVGWSEAMISLQRRDLVEVSRDADGLAVFTLTEAGRRELGLCSATSFSTYAQPLEAGVRSRPSSLAERARPESNHSFERLTRLLPCCKMRP